MWPKAEERVAQRKGIAMFEMYRTQEFFTDEVKVEGS